MSKIDMACWRAVPFHGDDRSREKMRRAVMAPFEEVKRRDVGKVEMFGYYLRGYNL